MELLNIIQDLEKFSTIERYQYIKHFLAQHSPNYTIQQYRSGTNLLVKPTTRKPVIAISSHFDVVPQSPGANDNASAIAVCFGILTKLKTHPLKYIEVAIFFFDEEETGLKGSKAYTNEYGITDLLSLVNLELVGQGDKLALWPLNDRSTGKVLEAFEKTAFETGILTRRFDQIVTNSADHLPFQQAGLKDAFTVTCVSEEDLAIAFHYYKAQEFEVEANVLQEIIQQAPIFKNYHKPTDLSIHLSEASLQMTTNTIWNTLLKIDRQFFNPY